MSEKTQATASNKNANNETWAKKNVPSLVGGGTFALLILITLLMYFANT